MNKLSAVIIDDEEFNRNLVRSLIGELDPDMTVTAEAAGVIEGYNIIRMQKPDVVFLDIKMPDGSGFDLLKLFDKMPFEVVFVTGFDEYALKAFEYNALDYVLKPLNTGKFSATLSKVRHRVRNNLNSFESLKKIAETYDARTEIITRIPIHQNDKVILLAVHDIMYIQSQEGCTWFYKSRAEKHVSARQLSDFDFILGQFPNFLKITKSAYINLNFIDSYSKGLDCTLTMKDGSVHEVSRRKKTSILKTIGESKKS